MNKLTHQTATFAPEIEGESGPGEEQQNKNSDRRRSSDDHRWSQIIIGPKFHV